MLGSRNPCHLFGILDFSQIDSATFHFGIHLFVGNEKHKQTPCLTTYKIDETIKEKKCLSQNLSNMHFVFHHFELRASNHTNKHAITYARLRWRWLCFCLLHLPTVSILNSIINFFIIEICFYVWFEWVCVCLCVIWSVLMWCVPRCCGISFKFATILFHAWQWKIFMMTGPISNPMWSVMSNVWWGDPPKRKFVSKTL